MKRISFFLLAILFCLAGCKENHSLVTLTNTSIVAKDTTYVLSSVPAAIPHNILFEDFTGVTCSNCPAAHDGVLIPLDSTYPGRLVIMEMFVTDFPQTSPNPGEVYGGFRTTVATQIEDDIYGPLSVLPCAGIDRIPNAAGSGMQEKAFDWGANTASQLSMADSINIGLSSSYNPTTDTVTIIDTVTYLYATVTPLNLSIAILEDSLIDLQEFPASVQSYHYNGVLRDMVTPSPYGDTVFTTRSAIVPGRVKVSIYKYHLNTSWMYKNCRVVAFVSAGQGAGGAPVYQSAQCKLSK